MRTLALSASLVVLFFSSSLAALSIDPGWTAGDRWVVKSIYYHAEKAVPYWSEPLFWQFEVKGQQMLEGKNCLVIEAHGVPEVDEWGRLYLALPGLSPVLLEGHITSHGEEKIVRTPFEGEKPLPVTPHVTTIPFALPALPIVLPEEDAVSRSSRHIVKGNSASRGCIGSSLQVEQKVEAAGSAGAGKLPDLSGAVTPAGPLYRVTLEAPREKITQYWSEDLPWYLYSEDGTSRSWLWKIETFHGGKEE
jgi:hypothetical protein